eukprot:TRINITY_DN4126_c0_g1_i16.p4 TRINITY_DN4126_c0_g1~~TRINITY_DN4126_c0_g1_i16.p4  ORF type:complete len:118 (+),score=7.49 TRINITY_DN4126_c0_g1_i16:679-1032(+)
MRQPRSSASAPSSRRGRQPAALASPRLSSPLCGAAAPQRRAAEQPQRHEAAQRGALRSLASPRLSSLALALQVIAVLYRFPSTHLSVAAHAPPTVQHATAAALCSRRNPFRALQRSP